MALLLVAISARSSCPSAPKMRSAPSLLPQAPRMPVCKRSAPAHESILLIRRTWNGCGRTRMWKKSFPPSVIMYLFAAMRAASRHSLVYCCWEFIAWNLLLACLVDTDLGIWHTTAEATLGEWLVLAVPVATSRTAAHCYAWHLPVIRDFY